VSGSVAGKVDQLQAVYDAVYAAVRNRQPIAAMYKEFPRLFCPHRLGRNSRGEPRVLCYQYGGESESGLAPPGSADNWRCIALDKVSGVEPLDGPWHTAPNHSRPASCIVDPDIDAEDYPERDPQQGQRGSSASR
jgi:hypothetical protein